MDRQIVYPGQILPETSLLQMAKDAMIGVAKLSAAVLGTSTMANGFAVTPTGPASLQVVCAPGEIYSLTSIDALAFSTLPADTTHSIMKQGIMLDGVTLSCPAPGTSGQSINYLIQVTYQDSDSTPVLLPYYNSANPALPYSGAGNNGLTQNTSRKGVAVVSVKAGASAVTGSQVTPAPDAGYVGLYVVTVAFGQTTITGGSIAQFSGAPLLPAGLLQSMQAGQTTSATDIGVANAYAANFTPAITSLSDKMVLCIKAVNANTTASTFTPAPGVIAAAPIVGCAHTALQGGEIIPTGDLWLQWNSSIGGGSWVLIDGTGGGMQVAPATKSQHAVQAVRVGTDGGLSFRRLNHNGNFNINQRTYVSGTATIIANQLTLDRWKVKVLGQSVTFAASGIGNAVTAPAGGLEQVAEGKDVVGGTYCASWIGAGTLTVNGVATAKGASFTLPANTNATFVIVGAVSQFQVELGTVPTQFEFWPTAVELAICQRYAYVLDNNSENVFAGWGFMLTANTVAGCILKMPVTMRAKPTINSSPGDTGVISAYSISPSNAGAINSIYWGGDTTTIGFSAASASTVGYPCAYFLQGGRVRLVFSADI